MWSIKKGTYACYSSCSVVSDRLQILAGEKGARKAGEEAWVCLGHVVLGPVPSCLQAAAGTTLHRRLLMSVCDEASSKQRTGTRVQLCFMRAAPTQGWVVTTGGRKSCLIYIYIYIYI
jgi:hypothetical protein